MNAIYIGTNYTPREVVNMHGFLPEDMAHEVIDLAEFADKAADIACDVREGNCHPEEDFLQSVIDSINELAKKMRGDNKETLRELADKLLDIQTSTMNDSEYRREKLNAAIAALEG